MSPELLSTLNLSRYGLVEIDEGDYSNDDLGGFQLLLINDRDRDANRDRDGEERSMV
jgi:hypothetical protein